MFSVLRIHHEKEREYQIFVFCLTDATERVKDHSHAKLPFLYYNGENQNGGTAGLQYRKDISLLGYGCMRFTKDKSGRIDLAKAEREVMRAYELGVNYFDTAYIYGGSEEAMGEIIERNGIRDKIKLVTKLPQYLVRDRKGLDKYLSEELKRLRTDYLDYYLMHHMTDTAQLQKLLDMGLADWVAEKKASGQIRKIGFSFHGNTETFLQILNGFDWDITLVQYNYMDEFTQAGRAGVEAAAAKGIPVVIMEPLRGGKLVDLLPQKAKDMIASDPHGWTPAEWAFRWIWDQEAVTCVLSGMNSIEMIEENCRVASEVVPGQFGEAESAMISRIREAINETMKIGCTACGYCMPCPAKIDIPGYFRCYNHIFSEKKSTGFREFFQTVALSYEKNLYSACLNCGKCEKHCPQNIPIREKLKVADKALRPLPTRILLPVAKRIMLGKRPK